MMCGAAVAALRKKGSPLVAFRMLSLLFPFVVTHTFTIHSLSLSPHHNYSTHQHPPAPCVLKQRKKGFKKSIDVDEGRRRREETTIQIRKTAKDVRLAKRRQMPGAADGGMGGGGGGGYSNMNTPAALAAASMLAAGGVAPGGYGERIIPIFPPPSFFISH